MKFEDPVVHQTQELRRKQKISGFFNFSKNNNGSQYVDDTPFRKWGFRRWDKFGDPAQPGPPIKKFVRNLIVGIIIGLISFIFYEEIGKKKQPALSEPTPFAANNLVPPNIEISRNAGPTSGATTPEQVFQRVSRSVVVVEVFDGNRNRVSQGSGVVVSRGYVITNRHVVERGNVIRVRQSGFSYDAKVQYADREYDLCGLNVNGLPAEPVTLRSVNNLVVGQRVYAIGAPQGLELSMSEGLVSSLRPIGGSLNIQTTAAISHGSSGGGLFDRDGFLVGITTFVLKDGQNLNFALPADLIHGLPARAMAMNRPQPIATQSVVQSPTQRPDPITRLDSIVDMGHVVEKESVRNGFRSQASFSAYSGYIIINPVDLEKFPAEKSMEMVQVFISRIGNTVYDKGLADGNYKLYVQIQGVEYITNVHKCRQGQWNLLEKAHK